jgi:ArsR family transcriptional regulator
MKVKMYRYNNMLHIILAYANMMIMDSKNTKDIYRAFSNKNRVKLIICLSKAKNVTDLLRLCDLSQSALSQHLKILKDEGVAVCKRDGKNQIYSINDKKSLEVAKLLLALDK